MAALGPIGDKGAQQALKLAETAHQEAGAQRSEAEAKYEALAAEIAAQRARANALAEAARVAAARVQRTEEFRRGIETQLRALPDARAAEMKLADARVKAGAAKAENARLMAALKRAEAALQQAQSAEERAWRPYRTAENAARDLDAEVRALANLAPPAGAEFPPVLAALEVEPGYERALAAALGDDLDASVLKQAPAHWAGATTPTIALPRGANPLGDVVKAPPALAARLALVGIVDAKDGARLARDLSPGVRLVSREGDLWRWDGFVRRANAPQPAAARIEHKNRLRAAQAELKASEKRHAEAKIAWEKAKTERQDREVKLRELRTPAPKLAAAENDANRELARLDGERARLAETNAALTAQLEHFNAESAEARASARALSTNVETKSDDSALTQARFSMEQSRQAAAEASAALHALTRDQSQRQARRDSIVTEIAQWRARGTSADQRLAALGAELDEIETRREAAKAAPEIARAKLEDIMDEAGAAEIRRAQASDRLAEAQAGVRAASDASRAAEQTHAAAREQRASAEAHAGAAAQRLVDLDALAHEQTGAAAEALAGLAGNMITGPLASAPIGELERRLERLKAERDAAGPVNLRAEEELAEAQERVATLSKEKDDVAQAIAKLRRAITTLNNEGRTRLMAAFEQVNAHFAQLFAALFDGGQAALRLTENDDPLNAGLEIFAQPPGKRLTHLSLLSGGEQALTATALIFAVFLSNPAPLCVLDEVDAPLDDANVDRFCRLLDEMKRLTTTRFIVITHNPVTMSRMDRLYGVTMPEQGLSQLGVGGPRPRRGDGGGVICSSWAPTAAQATTRAPASPTLSFPR